MIPAEPRLFPEEVEAIRIGLLAGESYAGIARKLDRDRTTVTRCARRLGIKSKAPRGRRVELSDPTLVSVIRARIEAGQSFHKIAASMACDTKAISNLAKRLGLKANYSFGGSREIAA